MSRGWRHQGHHYGLRWAPLGGRPRNEVGTDEEREGAEVAVAKFHKKVKDAFEVFDHESSNTVNVREIGTIPGH